MSETPKPSPTENQTKVELKSHPELRRDVLKEKGVGVSKLLDSIYDKVKGGLTGFKDLMTEYTSLLEKDKADTSVTQQTAIDEAETEIKRVQRQVEEDKKELQYKLAEIAEVRDNFNKVVWREELRRDPILNDEYGVKFSRILSADEEKVIDQVLDDQRLEIGKKAETTSRFKKIPINENAERSDYVANYIANGLLRPEYIEERKRVYKKKGLPVEGVKVEPVVDPVPQIIAEPAAPDVVITPVEPEVILNTESVAPVVNPTGPEVVSVIPTAEVEPVVLSEGEETKKVNEYLEKINRGGILTPEEQIYLNEFTRKQEERDQAGRAPIISTETPPATTEATPKKWGKVEVAKLMNELKLKDLPELKYDWQVKSNQVEVLDDNGSVKRDKKGNAITESFNEFTVNLKSESKDELANLLDKKNIPEEIKSDILKNLIQTIEDRMSKSLDGQAKLEEAKSLKYHKKQIGLQFGLQLALSGGIAMTRWLSGVAEAASHAIGNVARVGGFSVMGAGAGGGRFLINRGLMPELNSLILGKENESSLHKAGVEVVNKFFTTDTVKTLGKQVLSELLAEKLKGHVALTSETNIDTIKSLLKEHCGSAFENEAQIESFSRELAAIEQIKQGNQKQLAKYMERLKLNGFLNSATKSAIAGGTMAAVMAWVPGLGQVWGGAFGAFTMGGQIKSALRRMGIEERYQIMREQILGLEQNRSVTKKILKKVSFGWGEKKIAGAGNIMTEVNGQKRANEVMAYLVSGLLVNDPLLQARAESLIQQAAEQGIMPEQAVVEARVKALEKKLKIERATENVAYAVGTAVGAATSWAAMAASELFKGGSGSKVVVEAGTSKGSQNAGELNTETHNINKGPGVQAEHPPIAIKIEGNIDTVSEAVDKALHGAPTTTQDNFVHKELGDDVAITDSNRHGLVVQAVREFSIRNIKMGDGNDLLNRIHNGDTVLLKSDGAVEVKGTSGINPEAVAESTLRKSAAELHTETQTVEVENNPLKNAIWQEGLVDGKSVKFTELPFDYKTHDLNAYAQTDSDTWNEARNLPDTIELHDRAGNVIDYCPVDPSDTRSLSEVLAEANKSFGTVDSRLHEITEAMPKSGYFMSAGSRTEIASWAKVDIHSGAPLSETQIHDLNHLDNIVGNHATEYLGNSAFKSFLSSNFENLNASRAWADFQAVKSLHGQGFGNVDIKSVDFINKTAGWVRIGENNSGSGFMAQVENGALHTSLKSPLTGSSIEVSLPKDKVFNFEMVNRGVNQAIEQQSAEMNVKSNLESMVGSSEANEILKLPAGSNIEQEILDIAKNKVLFVTVSDGNGPEAVKYLNGLTDLTKGEGTLAEQLSKAVVQGRVASAVESVKSTPEVVYKSTGDFKTEAGFKSGVVVPQDEINPSRQNPEEVIKQAQVDIDKQTINAMKGEGKYAYEPKPVELKSQTHQDIIREEVKQDVNLAEQAGAGGTADVAEHASDVFNELDNTQAAYEALHDTSLSAADKFAVLMSLKLTDGGRPYMFEGGTEGISLKDGKYLYYDHGTAHELTPDNINKIASGEIEQTTQVDAEKTSVVEQVETPIDNVSTELKDILGDHLKGITPDNVSDYSAFFNGSADQAKLAFDHLGEVIRGGGDIKSQVLASPELTSATKIILQVEGGALGNPAAKELYKDLFSNK